MPLAAEFADEWNGNFVNPATFRERSQLLDDLLGQFQRAPGDVKRSLTTNVRYAADDADLAGFWRGARWTRRLITARQWSARRR